MKKIIKKILNNSIVRIVAAVIVFVALTNTISIVGIDNAFYDSIKSLKNKLVDIKIVNTIKNEKQLEVDGKYDLAGLWKSKDTPYDKRYEAKIGEDSITVYKYNGMDITDRIIYWSGTFDITEIVDKGTTTSKNYNEITRLYSSAAQSAERQFKYDNGTLSFVSNFDDDMKTISFKKFAEDIERARVAKYSKGRISYFNNKENKKIVVGKYTIQYPKYFDNEEEQTRINFANPDSTDWMRNNNFIVLSPSNTNSYAELFIADYNNGEFESNYDIDRFVSLLDETYADRNNYLISESMDETYDYLSNEYVYITKYEDKETSEVTYGMAFETHLFYKNTRTMLTVGVTYGYNDVTDYDYLADYREILKNISLISE